MEPRIGQYRLEGEVARGGMGVVFRARGPDGTTVALKLLHAGRGASEVQRRRFAREAEALARITHPGVVRLREVGEHQGAPFLVLEWLEGESLEARIARQGPLAPRDAAWLVARLARSMAHCHERGVLHRDLKPENVLLRSSDGEPLLVDFGLTLDLLGEHSLTRTGQLMGTPGWWSPEQARGDPAALGPHTDVYGLGAVLHAALTGRSPWEPGTLIDALAAAEKDPLPPSRHRPGIPRALDEVCLRCLAREPRARWPDARTVAEQLERWLAGAAREPARRRALLVGGLVLVALALTLGVALRISAPPPPPVEPPPPPPPPPALDPLVAAAAATSAGRFDEARAALAPIASGSDPRRAAEALWALHHLAAIEDPEQPLAETPPLRALLHGRVAPPWTDRALVIALLAGQRHADALDSGRDLVSLYPDDPWSLFLLSVAVTRSGGSPDEAFELARRACELAPDWVTPRLAVVFLHQDARRFAEALVEIERALALPRLPARARARFLSRRCDLLMMSGDSEGALAAVAELQRLSPHDREGRTLAAMVHLSRDELDQTLAALDQAAELGPPEPLELVFRADVHHRRGDLPGAVELQGRALARDPTLVDVRVERLRLLSILGRTEEGLREIAVHFGGDPRDPDVLVHRGWLRLQDGDLAGAEGDLGAAVRRANGMFPKAEELQVYLLAARGAADSAELERLIAQRPRSGRPLLARSRQHLATGRSVEALADAEAALRAEPCLRLAAIGVGKIALGLNEQGVAVKAFTAAERLAPLSANEELALAQALVVVGPVEDARARIERVLRLPLSEEDRRAAQRLVAELEARLAAPR